MSPQEIRLHIPKWNGNRTRPQEQIVEGSQHITPSSVTQGVPQHEVALIRELARKVAAIASEPIQQQRKQLWISHNRLDNTKPLIMCDPENGWNEIITPADIQCQHPRLRGYEMDLRMRLFRGEKMHDDVVVDDFINVPHAAHFTNWGMESQQIGEGGSHAYTWTAPIQDYERDLPKLRLPQLVIDKEASDEMLAFAHEVFDGILRVRRKQSWWWSLGVTFEAVRLRGIEQMLVDMCEEPDGLHALMNFICEGHLNKIKQLEEVGLLYQNNDGSYVGSGGWGWSDEIPTVADGQKVTAKQMWGFTESQETVNVSPHMYAEYVFPYERRIMEKFALTCYGCCEPIHSRWHIVKQHPNLRRVSVSPWCSLESITEALGPNYITSFKPNPSHLAMDNWDEELVRKTLRHAFSLAKQHNCRAEAIMKDNHTIRNQPERVLRWVAIAKEEASRW